VRVDAGIADGLGIISSLASAVKKGRHFEEWELAGIPEGMLGRRDLTGIVLGGPVTDSRVKVAGPTVTVLLITQDELDVAFHFGAPRVMNLLARRDEFFPYPPWVDRNRKSVCSPAEMKTSPVAQSDADARMVFSKLGDDPIAVSRNKNGDAAKIAGVFLVLTSSDDESGAVVTEDGFSVFVPAPRCADAVTALEAGRPFAVAAGKNTLPFSIGFER
jgi:hypothetical protein